MSAKHEKMEALFNEALKRKPEERDAFLAEACGNDAELRRQVDELLQAECEAGPFLPEAPRDGATVVTVPITEMPGDAIGRYKLLQKLGEGGMGAVWMAEQREPVRRKVALKIIKLGMDTREVTLRFEAERQALALMDHPNIAKVLDGGATDSGRPYFVMELVPGIRLTHYCDQNRLSIRERLDLFMKVCHAVQHAHQKGIIHRDLKPSNILVTLHDGVPVPKVIDFGIAKATQQPLTEQTLFTQLGAVMGTPAYMSPEQAELSGLDIDTRSDIYSLGVLLYQLLTGRPPFEPRELKAAGVEQMLRIIREREPPRPSTRLTTLEKEHLEALATRHGTQAPKLVNLIRGDLDWIVMKCLEKDRTRRYETANGLAADLKRHLVNEPVLARPPSSAYRLQKVFRRNKLVFTAATVVAVALVVGAGVSTWQAVRATRAEREQARLFKEASAAQASEAKLRKSSEERLYDSLVSEARTRRSEHRVGFRDEVFRIVRQANALNVPQKNLTELRTAAVACMGDPAGFTPVTFTNFPTDTKIRQTEIDSTGQFAAFRLMDGTILMLDLKSGEVVGRLSAKGTSSTGWIHFNSAGDIIWDYYWDSWLSQERKRTVWTRAADGHWQEKETFSLPKHWQWAWSVKGDFLFMEDLKTNSHKLVEVHTTNVVLRFELPEGVTTRSVTEATLSHDGRFLVMSWPATNLTRKFVIDLWDLSTGRNVKRFEPGFSDIASLNFSRDGKYLVCLSASGGALYQTSDGERVADFPESFKGPITTTFGFDNSVIALPLQQQGQLRLWDWVDRRDFAVLQEPEVTREATFAPDGSFLLTSGRWSARLYRWSSVTEKVPLADTVPGKVYAQVAFSADSKRLVMKLVDGKVRVVEAASGQTLWEPDLPPDATWNQGYGSALAMSSDGLLAVGSSKTQRIWIWDERDRKRVGELGTNLVGDVHAIQFTPDGRHLVAVMNDQSQAAIRLNRPHILVWPITRHRSEGPEGGLDFRFNQSPPLEFPDESQVWSDFGVAPDGQHFAIGSVPANDPALARSDILVWRLGGPAAPRFVLKNSHFTFTPGGKRLLTLGGDREVVEVDMGTGQTVPPSVSVRLPNSPPEMLPGRYIRLSPEGTRLAVASADGRRFDIWDWNSRRYFYSLGDQETTVRHADWSPNSRSLVVEHEYGGAAIWNIQEVEQTLTKLGLMP